jgi:yecA family protein
LQAGFVLKGAGGEWMSHAATAAALLDGRPLAKIPVMRQIVANTLDAFVDHQEADEGIEISFADAVSAEELSDLLAAVGMVETAPRWLDGYLTAVLIAPKVPDPDAWVGGLMEAMSGPLNPEAAQSLLFAVISRYNEIRIALSEQGEATGIAELTDKDLKAWARGFIHGVTTIPAAWKARSLKKDDKNLIDLIGKVAADKQLSFNPRAIVGTWVAARFCKAG